MSQQRPSNSNSKLTLSTDSASRVLDFDFPAMKIGAASYVEGPTGCTVFYFPQGARFVADVRGGSPGVVLLGQWESGEQFIDAICLTGGSVYGLESLSGIYSEILVGRSFDTDWRNLARVQGAVIYDYRPRDNAIYPDKELGRTAFRTAKTGLFPLGRAGAGSCASVGKLAGPMSWEFAGQGGAFQQIGPTRICLFTVVNAVGAIVNRSGTIVRGNIDQKTGDRLPPLAVALANHSQPPGGNTTLTVLVINQKISCFALRQIAKQVHCSMARAIHPFHALTDGDVLFAVSTDEVENPALSDMDIGTIAAELAWDAVLTSFP